MINPTITTVWKQVIQKMKMNPTQVQTLMNMALKVVMTNLTTFKYEQYVG